MRVKDWERWQTYRKDRGRPPWIKLHREVLRNPQWVMLTDAQRGQLVSMWILAADRDGELPDDPKLIAKLCYMDDEPDLQLFVAQGFLDAGVNVTSSRRQGDAPEVEVEENRNRKETASPRIVEKPRYTKGELLEDATKVLGLNKLTSQQVLANSRIINIWLYSSEARTEEDIYAAIHGAAMMRDADLIGWESAKPGMPISLRALNGPMTLAHLGDGKVQQTLWYAAVDYFRRNDGQGKEVVRGEKVVSMADALKSLGVQ